MFSPKSWTSQLDDVAAALQGHDPRIAMAIDRISDQLEKLGLEEKPGQIGEMTGIAEAIKITDLKKLKGDFDIIEQELKSIEESQASRIRNLVKSGLQDLKRVEKRLDEIISLGKAK